MLSTPESINATSVKENSLLIIKIIYVSLFWKITLSIILKKFYLLLSSSLLFETLISITSLSVGGSGTKTYPGESTTVIWSINNDKIYNKEENSKIDIFKIS